MSINNTARTTPLEAARPSREAAYKPIAADSVNVFSRAAGEAPIGPRNGRKKGCGLTGFPAQPHSARPHRSVPGDDAGGTTA